jgi:phage I-like protein
MGLFRFLSRARLATAASADAIATCGVIGDAPADAAAGTPSRLLLFPMGEVTLRDGRKFRLEGAEHAARVIAASTAYAGRRDIPCDYDHQLVYGVGKGAGGQAPAAGWIKPASLQADAQGIWGEVEWTATAATRLAAREYRYTSPSFTHDAAGRVTSIRFLSLVNDNAIDELPAVASTQETTVNYAKIAAALGLPPEASEDDILAALAKMAMPAAAMASAATALGLAADATAEAIATAAATAASKAPDPAKFVPMAALDEARGRLAVLEKDRQEKLVTAATEAGKLSPAERAWALDYIAKDEAGFNAMIAARPAIVTAGTQLGADPAAKDKHGLTADELSTAAALGLTPEQFAAAKTN